MQDKYENRIGGSIQAVIFDCNNPEALARFYAQMLGGEVSADPFGGYCVTAKGLGVELGFQKDEDYVPPVWPYKKGGQLQMLHLDLKVADRKKAMEYALSIGATMPEEQFCRPEWEVQWVTMLDPAGHPFCLWSD